MEICNVTLQGHDNFDHMRIALSRPKNLKDILCRTKLREIDDQNVSDILSTIQPQPQPDDVIQTKHLYHF